VSSKASLKEGGKEKKKKGGRDVRATSRTRIGRDDPVTDLKRPRGEPADMPVARPKSAYLSHKKKEERGGDALAADIKSLTGSSRT